MSSIAVPRAVVPRRAWQTDLPVLLVAVVWGASYLAAKDITTARTVLAVLVLRFALVLPVLAVVGHRSLRALTAAQWRGAALLGLILAGIFLLETYGVVHTSATNAGLIISLTMIFTPLAEAAVTRTRPSRGFLGAAALSVLGVLLLTQGAGFTRPSLGDLLMLLAALARTLHVLAMSRTKAVRGADALPLTTVQLGTAVAVFALLSTGADTTPWETVSDFGVREWAGLLFLSVFCTLFAFFVQMWAVRRTSPSRVSLLLGTEPPVGRRGRYRPGRRTPRRARTGGRPARPAGDSVGARGRTVTPGGLGAARRAAPDGPAATVPSVPLGGVTSWRGTGSRPCRGRGRWAVWPGRRCRSGRRRLRCRAVGPRWSSTGVPRSCRSAGRGAGVGDVALAVGELVDDGAGHRGAVGSDPLRRAKPGRASRSCAGCRPGGWRRRCPG